MVPILLLIGEITPKTLAIRNNVAVATFESKPIDLFAKAITPIRWTVRNISEWFTTLIVGKEHSCGKLVYSGKKPARGVENANPVPGRIRTLGPVNKP